jgi:hypothetical protein
MLKGKKEYLIPLVIIALVASYLYFRRTDQVNYQLPQLAAVDIKAVTSIQVSSGGQNVTIKGKDRAWTIEPAGYPADFLKVQKMLHDIGALELTDMVSDSKNYSRYDLGPDGRITVKAYAGERLVRQFDVGKVAPSSRHTYVMLPGDPRVYQAKDSFRDDFQGTATSFRDRKVLGFVMDDVRKATITMGARSVTLTRSTPEDKPGAPAVWVSAAGKEASKSDMDLLVSTLSSLECSAFLDALKKADLGSPTATVTLTGGTDYTFSAYPKKGAVTPLASSGSDYVFTLQDYQLDAILKALEKLSKTP